MFMFKPYWSLFNWISLLRNKVSDEIIKSWSEEDFFHVKRPRLINMRR